MAVSYSEYGDRLLNQIVMAGSHDAGIDTGKKNVKTQDVNLLNQAIYGVRVFDLRVKGHATGTDPITHKAFHGHVMKDKKQGTELLWEKKSNGVVAPGGTTAVKGGELTFGSFGMSLTDMLSQAKQFVKDSGEFVILKFHSSCDNWDSIAGECLKILGTHLHNTNGDLNNIAVRALSGKVIVVFDSGGWNKLNPIYKAHDSGIYPIHNACGGKNEAGDYRTGLFGMQYYGKGGTSLKWGVVRTEARTIKANEKTQKDLMQKGASKDPRLLGMMYWTTTGLSSSIELRNGKMWTLPKQERLAKLWESSMREGVQQMLSSSIARGATNMTYGMQLKSYFPNIVMIDFADTAKCELIFSFNKKSPADLLKMDYAQAG